MKVTELVEKTITKSVVKSAKCDFCGKVFEQHAVDHEWFNTIEIKTTYGSRFDGFRFTGEICDDCIDKHFSGKLRKEEISFT